MAGGAYEELARSGGLGPKTLELLQITARIVTKATGFPSPSGQRGWTDEDIFDVITNMILRPGVGQQWVTMCFANAYDDRSLQALFYTSIGNYLKDEAKKTPRGKLRRRFASRLDADGRFRKANVSGSPWWMLSEHDPDARWQGDIDDLTAVAWQVDGIVDTLRLNRSGPTPRQTVHALMTVITAVLEYAGGAVREEDLAKVLEARFGLDTTPQLVTLYSDDAPQNPPGWENDQDPDDDDEEQPQSDGSTAERIWAEFTDNERLLLPHLGREATEVAEELNIGVKQAQAAAGALHERLRPVLEAAADRRALLGELLRRSADHRAKAE